MKEYYLIVPAAVLVTIGLWFGIHGFIGGTDSVARVMNANSVAYEDKKDDEDSAQEVRDQETGELIAIEDPFARQMSTLENRLDLADPTAIHDDVVDIATEDVNVPASARSVNPAMDRARMASDPLRLKRGTGNGQSVSVVSGSGSIGDSADNTEGPDLVHEVNFEPDQSFSVSLFGSSDACRRIASEDKSLVITFKPGNNVLAGHDILAIERLVASYYSCGRESRMQFDFNDDVARVVGPLTTERRQQEIKYHLLQRRVPRSAIALKKRSS